MASSHAPPSERDDRAHRDAVAGGAQEEQRLVEREAQARERHESERRCREAGARWDRAAAVGTPGEQERDHCEAGTTEHKAHHSDREGGGVVGAERLRGTGRAEEDGRGEHGEDRKHPPVLPGRRGGVELSQTAASARQIERFVTARCAEPPPVG